MSTSKISVSEGTGKNLATYSKLEDAVTKEMQRVVLNDSNGNEISSIQEGVQGDGITIPTGGSGILGWLSGIYQKLSGALQVSITNTFLSTKDYKENTKAMKVFSAVFSSTVAEGLVSLTPITNGVAAGAVTSYVIPNGKTLRICALSVNTKNAAAAGQGIVCNLRINTTGSVVIASPLIATVGAGTVLAIANIVGCGLLELPEGIDIPGNGTTQIGVSQIGTANAGNTVTVIGYEY